MTKLEVERAARASTMMEMTAATAPVGLFQSLTGATLEMAAAFTEATRRAEEDAAMGSEDILTQAEEADALDHVG